MLTTSGLLILIHGIRSFPDLCQIYYDQMNFFSYFCIKASDVGTQKNSLNDMVLLR